VEIPYEIIETLIAGKSGSVAQNVLLLMIFLSSRKTAKAVDKLSTALTRLEISHELRIQNLEDTVRELKTKLPQGQSR
jgi:hypothetical protein